MTLSAVYCFVSKNAIPKKKEGIMVYYSKKHVDIAKGVATPEEPKYYTVPEAMEKFNLTRDQLYHYAKYQISPRSRKANTRLSLKPNWINYSQPQRLNKFSSVAVVTIESPYSFAPNKYKTLNIKQHDTHVYKSNSSSESDS